MAALGTLETGNFSIAKNAACLKVQKVKISPVSPCNMMHTGCLGDDLNVLSLTDTDAGPKITISVPVFK